ncbi:ALF repeat-containing protein [Streptomyces sp. NBC_00442]|uniref:ALF repeat-containing protein n=1 Tax=Streptomyces sp. NBC_00442 TaxID=2903651 RepID=UPI002E1C45BC
MRPTLAALLIAAAALAPALAVATPAFASGTTAASSPAATAVSGPSAGPASEDDDRVAVSRILGQAIKDGDRRVIRDANTALDANTPEALRTFLDTGYRLAQAEDDSVATTRILGVAQKNGDRAVIREATKALDNGSAEALRTFRTTGYRLAQAEDDSVATTRILGVAQKNGDRAVIREATKALDNGTPEALRTFRTTGYRLAQAEDDSVAISRILARPGISDALRAACNKALDGTPEDMRYFLVTGQYEVAG